MTMLSILLFLALFLGVNCQTSELKVKDNLNFASYLFRTFANNNESANILISPISIQIILALTYYNDRDVKDGSVKWGLYPELVRDVYKKFFQSVNLRANLGFSLATKLYTGVKFKIQRDYKTYKVGYSYSGKGGGNDQSVIGSVFSWFAQNTHGIVDRIGNREKILNSSITKVAVNSVYLKADWMVKFRKMLMPLTGMKTKGVDYMQVQGDFRLKETSAIEAQILEMRYATGSYLKMVLVVPNKVDGLPEVEKHLRTAGALKRLLNMRAAKRQKLRVTMPRFKLRREADLSELIGDLDWLSSFGVSDEYNVAHLQKLRLNRMVHVTSFEVDEEGAVAASGTGIVENRRGESEGMTFYGEDVVVEHPFIMFVICEKTNNIVFVVKLADLSLEQNSD